MQDLKVIRRLFPLVEIYPWAIPTIVTLGVFASIFEGLGIGLFIPVLQSLMQGESQVPNYSPLLKTLFQLVDRIGAQEHLWVLPSLILLCILAKNILSYTNAILSAWLKANVSHRLRSQVFHQLLIVGHDHLETQDSGKLMNTLGGETWRVGQALAALINFITTLCTTIVFATLLMLISLPLTLIIGVVMGAISLGAQVVTHRVEALGQKAVENNAVLGLRMYEGLIGMRTIRSFGRESYEQQQFDRSSRRVQTALLNLEMLSATISPLYEILSALLVLTILVITVHNNQSSLPTLLTFLFMLYRLQPQMQMIDSYRTNLRSLSSSVKDVLNFLDPAGKSYLLSGSIPFHKLRQAITLDNVSFYYRTKDTPALDRVSLSIPLGTTTALVGQSGAGKSTLINLICRFYDPSSGKIWVDEQLLFSLKLEDWRTNIAIVSQDIHVFNTTIAENIAYGRLDATHTEIVSAAKQAQAHDFILAMPQGYETQVGDRGMRLSGGQRQRLALARAIVRNPDILILDEATNSLDSISEHLIQEALDLFSRDRTVIVIAHRLSTIEHADQIVVMHQGRVEERGTMEQLLKRNGLFTQMYRLQNRSLKSSFAPDSYSV